MKHRPEGVSIIAVVYYIVSVPGLAIACFVLVMVAGLLYSLFDAGQGQIWLILALVFVLAISIAWSIFADLAGWRLWNLKSWERWLAIILAVLSLGAFPVGTIFGVLVVWYLGFNEDAKRAFA